MFWKDESGQTVIEYTLIFGTIIIIGLLAFSDVGDFIQNLLKDALTTMQTYF